MEAYFLHTFMAYALFTSSCCGGPFGVCLAFMPLKRREVVLRSLWFRLDQTGREALVSFFVDNCKLLIFGATIRHHGVGNNQGEQKRGDNFSFHHFYAS